jgi:hypothetical protein
MQFTIVSYLDTAKRRHGIRSDRELSRRLGLAESTVNAYRVGRSFPEDDVMVRLARLAVADPAQALLVLNIARCKSPSAKAVYLQIMKGAPLCESA